MSNRIISGIAKASTIIASKNLAQSKLNEMSKSLDMPIDEYCRFQTLKSAYIGTRLTQDEAQSIYGFLGTSNDHFNQQPLAVKWVLTEMFQLLLKR